MELIKNIRKNTIILLLITVIVLVFVLKDDFNSVINTFSNMKVSFVLIAFLCFFISLFLKAYISYRSVNEKEKYSLCEALKHNVITQFFNGITPFSTGGQPMEIYMLTEHGIKGSRATSIIFQNFIFYQTALVMFGVFAVISNAVFRFFPKVPLLRELVLLGFIINTVVAIIIFFIAFSSKFTNLLLKVILKISNKLHLVKNKEKTKIKWEMRIKEFHDCAHELKYRKGLFILGVLFNFISLGFIYIIPYFIILGIPGMDHITAIESITASAYVLIMGSFVPIPGASGGIEYGFLAFFSNFIGKSEVSAVLLIWRFITYYLGMIVGGIFFNMDEGGKKCV